MAIDNCSCFLKASSRMSLSPCSLTTSLSSAQSRSCCDAPGGRGLQKQSKSAQHINDVVLPHFSRLGLLATANGSRGCTP